MAENFPEPTKEPKFTVERKRNWFILQLFIECLLYVRHPLEAMQTKLDK